MSSFDRELAAAVQPRPAAELVAAGVSKHVLDGPRWRRTSRGYYVPAANVPDTPTQRIVEAAAVLPAQAALAGWAAAYAWGADLLDGLDDVTMGRQPVLVSLPPGGHRLAAAGLRYVQQQLTADQVARRAGMSFTSPARTAADLLHESTDLTEAVVALDALLAAGVVGAELPLIPGRRGAVQARRALELARPGVRSTWESRLRLLYVLELGVATPLVNHPVLDLEGRLLGVPDLLDADAGLVLECDGSRWSGSPVVGGHRNRDQHRADNVREELFERAGLIVVRADGGDVGRYRRRLLARMSAARIDGLARDRSRDRWLLGSPSRRFSRFGAPEKRDSLLLAPT